MFFLLDRSEGVRQNNLALVSNFKLFGDLSSLESSGLNSFLVTQFHQRRGGGVLKKKRKKKKIKEK